MLKQNELPLGDKKYQEMVNWIISISGYKKPITIYFSYTKTHAAYAQKMSDGSIIIVYNPNFFQMLEMKTPHGVLGVLAHEVSHHFNDDKGTIPVYTNLNGTLIHNESHQNENNAECFAGWALGIAGATLDETLKVFEVYQFKESYTHPGARDRRQSMKNGWYASKKSWLPPVAKKGATGLTYKLGPKDAKLLYVGGAILGIFLGVGIGISLFGKSN